MEVPLSLLPTLLFVSLASAGEKPTFFKPVEGIHGCRGGLLHVDADGSKALCVSSFGNAGLHGISTFSLADGSLEGTVETETDGVVQGVTFSADGTRIGVATTSAGVLWNAADAKVLWAAPHDRNGQWSFTDEHAIYTTLREIRLLSPTDFEVVGEITTWGKSRDTPEAAAALAPAGEPPVIFTARDETLYSVEPGATGPKWEVKAEDDVESLALSPDGKVLAVLLSDAVELRQPSSGEVTRSMPLKKRKGRHLAWSPDGSFLAVGCVDGVQIFAVEGAAIVLDESWSKPADYGEAVIGWASSSELVAIYDGKKGPTVAKFQP